MLKNILFGLVFIAVPTSALAEDVSTSTPPVPDETVSIQIEEVEGSMILISTSTEAIGDDESLITKVEVMSDEYNEEDVPTVEMPVGTYIFGTIESNESWTKEKGPYYVEDIYIPSGVTVTVEAGTEIYANGYIAVFGNLILNGTEEQKINMGLNPYYSSWYIHLGEFANLDFTQVSINQADGITTQNGFIHFRNVQYLNASRGITINHFGSFTGENFSIKDPISGSGFIVTDKSSILLSDSYIQGSFDDDYIIGVYGQSNLQMLNTEVVADHGIPLIAVGSELKLDNVHMDGGTDDAIQLYPGYENQIIQSVATITNTKISNFFGKAIFAVDPKLSIVESKLINNIAGIEAYANSKFDIEVHDSVISDNLFGVVFGVQEDFAQVNFDVSGNWWGDKDGPYVAEQNDLTLGDEIVLYSDFAKEKIIFTPWLTKEPGVRVPVIIVPGVMASYLNKNDEDRTEVWPNVIKALNIGEDDYLDDLILEENGQLDLNNIFSTSLIRKIRDADFFESLISELTLSGYIEGKDLFVFPYDWRLNISDIVNGVEYSKTQSFIEKINEILKETKSDKIDIVAHSMGGLLAKYYIKQEGVEKVNKFIDIGTPHYGAPKAAKALIYGDDMDIKFWRFGLNPLKIKEISQNMPSAYNLLPSAKYFDTQDADYMYYLYDVGDVDGNGAVGRLSYEGSESFLVNTGRNKLLIENANTLHHDLDDFDPRDYGIEGYNIVGCGTPTIGKIFANKKQFKEEYEYQLKYISGDGTVPQRSAEAMNSDHLFYVNGVTHATMSSQNDIKSLISSIVTDNLANFDYSDYPAISMTGDNCYLPHGQIISIHSPVALHIYDESGNHVGPNQDGEIEYGIDGITYDVIEENKFAFIPSDRKYIVKFSATGIGSAGIDVQEYKDGEITKSESFYNIPISNSNTKGEITKDEQGSLIIFDENGNGDIQNLRPNLKVEGDLPQDTATYIETVEGKKSGNISGSISQNQDHLNMQTFQNLNDNPLLASDTVEANQIKAEYFEKTDNKLASSSLKESVNLENAEEGVQIAAVGDIKFFDYVVQSIRNLFAMIFNKIMSYFN